MSETKNKNSAKTEEVIRSMTLDELSYTLGTYCGPSNEFISRKKYGFPLCFVTVENSFSTRVFELSVLEQFENSIVHQDNFDK